MIARTGYGNRCLRRPCYLIRSQHGIHEVWTYYDKVAEPHGSSFLISHTREPERFPVGEEQLAQEQNVDPLSALLLLQTEVVVDIPFDTDQVSMYQFLQRSHAD